MTRFCLVLVLCASATAAPKWLQRVTLAASCAASAADAVTTYQAKHAGLREANPLLRASDGSPAMGRVVGLKIGLCAFFAWRQERGAHTTGYVIANSATATLFGAVAWHNSNLVDLARRR